MTSFNIWQSGGGDDLFCRYAKKVGLAPSQMSRQFPTWSSAFCLMVLAWSTVFNSWSKRGVLKECLKLECSFGLNAYVYIDAGSRRIHITWSSLIPFNYQGTVNLLKVTEWNKNHCFPEQPFFRLRIMHYWKNVASCTFFTSHIRRIQQVY